VLVVVVVVVLVVLVLVLVLVLVVIPIVPYSSDKGKPPFIPSYILATPSILNRGRRTTTRRMTITTTITITTARTRR
jgi:hypothetical protein